MAGMKEESRRPNSSPEELSEEVVCEIVCLKLAHMNWGPRKIRELYRLAYAREPETKETEAAKLYLETKAKQDAAKGKRTAYEDMIWALLNTKEFLFNH